MFLYSLIEKRLIKNILRLETCVLVPPIKSLSKKSGYFLGFRKGVYLLDVEKSIKVYFKTLRFVRQLRKENYQIMFVDSPLSSEKKLRCSLNASSFFKSCGFGALSTKVRSFSNKTSLVVVYGKKLSFSYKECFFKSVPAAIFLNVTYPDYFTDYKIALNLYSKGTVGLFLYLVNQSK